MTGVWNPVYGQASKTLAPRLRTFVLAKLIEQPRKVPMLFSLKKRLSPVREVRYHKSVMCCFVDSSCVDEIEIEQNGFLLLPVVCKQL